MPETRLSNDDTITSLKTSVYKECGRAASFTLLKTGQDYRNRLEFLATRPEGFCVVLL